jgi:hypothetical protein
MGAVESGQAEMVPPLRPERSKQGFKQRVQATEHASRKITRNVPSQTTESVATPQGVGKTHND